MMREDILQREKKLASVQLFLIRNKEGIIVAWCSAMPIVRKYAYIYTYVMRAHRRQGLGTRLINRAMGWCYKQNYKPKVISWDTQSSRFFSSLTTEIRVELADLA
jgi:GNAT superfamily N-acetyltransferase